MYLLDKYSDNRGHRKIDNVVFYNSNTGEYIQSIDRDYIEMLDIQAKHIHNIEIEYKQNNKINIVGASDIKPEDKEKYIAISKYSYITKEEFKSLKGNIKVSDGGKWAFKVMFIDLANCKILSDSVIKYLENEYIEYWCRCLFVQYNDNVFIKIPFYTQAKTKLKKAYFKYCLVNKLLKSKLACFTRYLTSDRNCGYEEFYNYGTDFNVKELCKYLSVEMLQQALKNKMEAV